MGSLFPLGTVKCKYGERLCLLIPQPQTGSLNRQQWAIHTYIHTYTLINTVQNWLEGDSFYNPKNTLRFTCRTMPTGYISHSGFLLSPHLQNVFHPHPPTHILYHGVPASIYDYSTQNRFRYLTVLWRPKGYQRCTITRPGNKTR